MTCVNGRLIYCLVNFGCLCMLAKHAGSLFSVFFQPPGDIRKLWRQCWALNQKKTHLNCLNFIINSYSCKIQCWNVSSSLVYIYIYILCVVSEFLCSVFCLFFFPSSGGWYVCGWTKTVNNGSLQILHVKKSRCEKTSDFGKQEHVGSKRKTCNLTTRQWKLCTLVGVSEMQIWCPWAYICIHSKQGD